MSTRAPTPSLVARSDAAIRLDPFGVALADRAHKAAIVDGTSTLTYAELNVAVGERARRFGTRRACEVLAPTNTIEGLVDYLGALRAGRVPLLTSDPRAHRDYQGASDLHPDISLVLATSGSTGSPRAVRLSHANITSNATAIAAVLGLDDTSRAITSLPLQYCYGLSVVHSHLTAGGSLVMSERSVSDDDAFWLTMSNAGVTTLAGVPHTFALLDTIGFPEMALPALRLVTQAGGRMDPDSVSRYREQGRRDGWEFVVMYGQTEATARMACMAPADADGHPDSVGRAIPGGSFRIHEPSGGVGEIVYRGPNVMMGYATTPDDLGRPDTVDELFTGDLGRLEDDFLVVTGRASRIAKPFGYRVDLDHLERGLADIGISAAATEVDAPEDHGTRVKVAVEGQADPREVGRHLHDHLTLPGAALEIVTVERLPRLASGKVDYPSLLTSIDPAPTTAPDSVAEVMARAVGVEVTDIDPDDTFVSLGGDSLGFVQCSLGLEDVLGTLPSDWHEMSVAELAERRVARRRWLASIDLAAALRAIAITAIVARHVRLLDTGWGAHALLALCGLNAARFQLARPAGASRRLVGATIRLALPAVAWLAVVVALDRSYRLANVLLVNDLTGSAQWAPPWRYWFVETLVQILLVTAALFSLPRFRRLDARAPFATALGATVVALVLRADPFDVVADERHLNHPLTTVWLFTLGWVIWRAATRRQQVVATLVVIVASAGYFGEWRRDLIVMAALVLTVWVRQITVPRPLVVPLGTVASASLFIYLTHWQVYPPLRDSIGPLGAGVASLLAGVVAWMAWDRLVQPHLPDWSRS